MSKKQSQNFIFDFVVLKYKKKEFLYMSNQKVEDYLDRTRLDNHEQDFEVDDLKRHIDVRVGMTLNYTQNLLKGREENFKEDYSFHDHINKGKMTIRSAMLASLYSGISLVTPFGSTKPLLDISTEGMTKALNDFNNAAQNATEYQEILMFINENILNAASTNITVAAAQIAIAAGVIATGAYISNGLKRNIEIENICKDVDKEVKHKNFTLGHASNVFSTLDSFYNYRLLYARIGENTKQYIKDIAAPVLQGIKNNISNPIIQKVRDILGDSLCDRVADKVKDMTPDFVKKFFENDNTVTTSDMLLYVNKKVKASELGKSENNPSSLNIQQEVSKIAQDVYETMQLTQVRRALINSVYEYTDARKNIEKLEKEKGIVNKLKLRKERKRAEKNMSLLKDIEALEELSRKEGRLSRFEIVSKAATKSIKKLNEIDSFENKSFSKRQISRNINRYIYNEETKIKNILKSSGDSKFANDIEKMMMPRTYSFERIFKQKVDELIENKENQLLQQKQQTLNKLTS